MPLASTRRGLIPRRPNTACSPTFSRQHPLRAVTHSDVIEGRGTVISAATAARPEGDGSLDGHDQGREEGEGESLKMHYDGIGFIVINSETRLFHVDNQLIEDDRGRM